MGTNLHVETSKPISVQHSNNCARMCHCISMSIRETLGLSRNCSALYEMQQKIIRTMKSVICRRRLRWKQKKKLYMTVRIYGKPEVHGVSLKSKPFFMVTLKQLRSIVWFSSVCAVAVWDWNLLGKAWSPKPIISNEINQRVNHNEKNNKHSWILHHYLQIDLLLWPN
jgi:hypothetical protein